MGFTPLVRDKSTFPTYREITEASKDKDIVAAPGTDMVCHLTGITISASNNTVVEVKDFKSGASPEAETKYLIRVPSYETVHINFPHTLEFRTNAVVQVSGDAQPYEVSAWGYIASPTS